MNPNKVMTLIICNSGATSELAVEGLVQRRARRVHPDVAVILSSSLNWLTL